MLKQKMTKEMYPENGNLAAITVEFVTMTEERSLSFTMEQGGWQLSPICSMSVHLPPQGHGVTKTGASGILGAAPAEKFAI